MLAPDPFIVAQYRPVTPSQAIGGSALRGTCLYFLVFWSSLLRVLPPLRYLRISFINEIYPKCLLDFEKV